jgi:CheY-like chemotaxis protein
LEQQLLLAVVQASRSFDIGKNHNAFFPAFLVFAQRIPVDPHFNSTAPFFLFAHVSAPVPLREPDKERSPLCILLFRVVRPTILVAESEPLQALSIRKLVLETAKFNVLTAHGTDEALDIFHLFPNVNAAVLVMDGCIDCELVARSIKRVTSKIPIIATSARIAQKCEYADHILCSHEPEALIKLMRTLVGDPIKRPL